MAMERWMMEVNTVGVVRVAEAFLLHLDGQVLCPHCHQGVTPRFNEWLCDRCHTRGNALMLAALASQPQPERNVSRQPDPDWAVVRARCEAAGLCRSARV
jgi:hypothetical protein